MNDQQYSRVVAGLRDRPTEDTVELTALLRRTIDLQDRLVRNQRAIIDCQTESISLLTHIVDNAKATLTAVAQHLGYRGSHSIELKIAASKEAPQ